MKLLLESKQSINEGIVYHRNTNTPLNESIYRYGSEKYFEMFSEARRLWQDGRLITENAQDIWFLRETDLGEKGRYNGKELLRKANEKRKLKYSEIEPKKPHAKKCMINGLIFNSAVEAAKHYNMPDSSVRDRLRNKNFTDWVWI